MNLRNIQLLSGLLLVVVAVAISVREFYSVAAVSSPAVDEPSRLVRRCPRFETEETVPVLPTDHHVLDDLTINQKSVAPRVSGNHIATSRSVKSNHLVDSSTARNFPQELENKKSESFLTADAPASPEQIVWHSANPLLIGNALSFAGKRAEILQYQPSPGSLGVGLSVCISPESKVESAVLPVDRPIPTNDGPHLIENTGFTYEQELFRTKWGWAAYDQIQKVLREETSE